MSGPKCTYCGGTDFYEGPSGGLAVNIRCANEECRHWFNYMVPLDKLEDLNRVEPTKEEQESERDKQQREREEYPEKMYKEGQYACLNRESAKSMLVTKPYWHEVNGADLYRLAGYIDAMAVKLNALL